MHFGTIFHPSMVSTRLTLKAFWDMRGVKAAQSRLQMGSNHIYRQPKWSRVTFLYVIKKHSSPFLDLFQTIFGGHVWAQTPQNAAKGAPGKQKPHLAVRLGHSEWWKSERGVAPVWAHCLGICIAAGGECTQWFLDDLQAGFRGGSCPYKMV